MSQQESGATSTATAIANALSKGDVNAASVAIAEATARGNVNALADAMALALASGVRLQAVVLQQLQHCCQRCMSDLCAWRQQAAFI